VEQVLHNDLQLRPITFKHNGSWRVHNVLADSAGRVYRRLGQSEPKQRYDQPRSFQGSFASTQSFHDYAVIEGRSMDTVFEPFGFILSSIYQSVFLSKGYAMWMACCGCVFSDIVAATTTHQAGKKKHDIYS
jgi:hypothetical protein